MLSLARLRLARGGHPAGGYCIPAGDAMIGKTLVGSSLASMDGGQNRLPPQAPALRVPNAAHMAGEVEDHLKGRPGGAGAQPAPGGLVLRDVGRGHPPGARGGSA
jgi:hypothetical protein